MSYTYESKKKPAEKSAVPKEYTPEVQANLQAIQNVDVHAGHKLNLESELKTRIERQTGFHMDKVELRESEQAANMDARAFAKGNVVQFAPGQFRPDTREGQELITHELTHVAQQARGGVHADVDGLNVNASEHLEAQADSGMLSLGGAIQDLPSMNAEAAPVQGLFGGIKRYFRDRKERKKAGAYHYDRQKQFGETLKAKNETVAAINAEHAAETDEMTKAMRAQGFSEEEMEAQMLFQRMNRASGRGARLMSAQETMRHQLDDGYLDPEDMASYGFKRGADILDPEKAQQAAAAERHLQQNVLYDDKQEARADELTASISQKYRNRNAAQGVFDAMEQDKIEKGNAFEAARERYKQRHGKELDVHSGDTYSMRYLARHLSGLSDEEADNTVEDFMSGDKARMAPHVKRSVMQFMDQADPDSVSAEKSDSEMLGNVLNQTLLSQDNMTIADMVDKGGFDAKTLGLSPEYLAEYKKKKLALGQNVGAARMRMKNMVGQGF